MEVAINGQVLSICEFGPDFFRLRKPINHPPVVAEVSVTIDGFENRWQVWLPEGIDATKRDVRIAAPPEPLTVRRS
jgi:hypothetical protein